MHLFAYRLNWLDAVDAWHLFTVILSAAFCGCCMLLLPTVWEKLPPLWCAAAGCVPTLLGRPAFQCERHSHHHPHVVTILAFWRWYEKPGWRRALGRDCCSVRLWR
jgi:hypothetical protein